MVAIAHISDTHDDRGRLKAGLKLEADVHVHSGDFSDMALEEEKNGEDKKGERKRRENDHSKKFQIFFEQALAGRDDLTEEEKLLFARSGIVPRLGDQRMQQRLPDLLASWGIEQKQQRRYVDQLVECYETGGDLREQLEKEAFQRLGRYAETSEREQARIIRESGKMVLGVAGNHDRKTIYDNMDREVYFLDRKSAKKIKGVRFGGVSGTMYERTNLDKEAYPHVYGGYVRGKFGREGEGKKLDKDPVLEEVVNENPDVLVVHKGAGKHAVVVGDKSGWHKGLEKALEIAHGIKLVLLGHTHDPRVKNVDGKRIEAVAGPNTSYVIEFNPDKKEVEYIDVYEYGMKKAA